MTHHVKKPQKGSADGPRGAQRRRPASRLPISILMATSMLPVAALTGCASFSDRHFKVGSVQSTYKTRHPIVIDEQEQTMDVPVASSSYDLPLASAGAVEGFAYRFRKSASSAMTVMVPSGSPNEAAARTVASKIVATLAKSGVPGHRVRMTSYHAAEHGSSAPVRLSYAAVKASVSGCGKWPEDLAGANTENQNYHNFGCATQNNLASQLANPADLLGPRGMSDIDAERRNNIIKDYRDGNISLPEVRESAFPVS